MKIFLLGAIIGKEFTFRWLVINECVQHLMIQSFHLPPAQIAPLHIRHHLKYLHKEYPSHMFQECRNDLQQAIGRGPLMTACFLPRLTACNIIMGLARLGKSMVALRLEPSLLTNKRGVMEPLHPRCTGYPVHSNPVLLYHTLDNLEVCHIVTIHIIPTPPT
jgi:hypothetical protein